jgi:hypothetical protein
MFPKPADPPNSSTASFGAASSLPIETQKLTPNASPSVTWQNRLWSMATRLLSDDSAAAFATASAVLSFFLIFIKNTALFNPLLLIPLHVPMIAHYLYNKQFVKAAVNTLLIPLFCFPSPIGNTPSVVIAFVVCMYICPSSKKAQAIAAQKLKDQETSQKEQELYRALNARLDNVDNLRIYPNALTFLGISEVDAANPARAQKKIEEFALKIVLANSTLTDVKAEIQNYDLQIGKMELTTASDTIRITHAPATLKDKLTYLLPSKHKTSYETRIDQLETFSDCSNALECFSLKEEEAKDFHLLNTRYRILLTAKTTVATQSRFVSQVDSPIIESIRECELHIAYHAILKKHHSDKLPIVDGDLL